MDIFFTCVHFLNEGYVTQLKQLSQNEKHPFYTMACGVMAMSSWDFSFSMERKFFWGGFFLHLFHHSMLLGFSQKFGTFHLIFAGIPFCKKVSFCTPVILQKGTSQGACQSFAKITTLLEIVKSCNYFYGLESIVFTDGIVLALLLFHCDLEKFLSYMPRL